MKIRLRLTLWYFSVTLAILLLFSLGTYWTMKTLLFRALDQELDIVSETILRSYDPFFNEFDELSFFPENLNRYIEYYLVVYNANAQPVYASPTARLISLDVPLTQSEIRRGYTVQTSLSENLLPYFHTNGEGTITFRVISHQLFFQDRQIGWLQVGLPIQRIQVSMEKLLYVLLGSIVIGVLMITTGGYFLTRKALNPVNKITQKATRISHSQLNERIEVVNPEDELGQLSVVLNNLLERLQKAFESQQIFLADVAHELKTPLSVLRAHWEEEINNPDLSLEIKEKIVHDIETISRLSHLINNLLLLSQTESIQSNFEFKSVDLDTLLSEVANDAQILAEIKSQEILIQDLPKITIRGDRTRLYQLFFNLIDNAIKYTPENGKVWLSLRGEDGWSKVEVRDNGPGIPPKDLPHIFERFYRVQKDRSRKTGGSGLGLSICKLITEAHQGSIETESELGKGSVFRVMFPLAT